MSVTERQVIEPGAGRSHTGPLRNLWSRGLLRPLVRVARLARAGLSAGGRPISRTRPLPIHSKWWKPLELVGRYIQLSWPGQLLWLTSLHPQVPTRAHALSNLATGCHPAVVDGSQRCASGGNIGGPPCAWRDSDPRPNNQLGYLPVRGTGNATYLITSTPTGDGLSEFPRDQDGISVTRILYQSQAIFIQPPIVSRACVAACLCSWLTREAEIPNSAARSH